MRMYGKRFIITLTKSVEGDFRSETLMTNLNGKIGECVTYSLKQSGILLLVLRVEDRLVVLQHTEVKLHPDEMIAIEEELLQLIRFKRDNPDFTID